MTMFFYRKMMVKHWIFKGKTMEKPRFVWTNPYMIYMFAMFEYFCGVFVDDSLCVFFN